MSSSRDRPLRPLEAKCGHELGQAAKNENLLIGKVEKKENKTITGDKVQYVLQKSTRSTFFFWLFEDPDGKSIIFPNSILGFFCVNTKDVRTNLWHWHIEWFLLTMKWLLRSNSSSILGRRRTVLKGGHGSQNFGPEFVPAVWMRDHQKQIFGGLTVENENKLTLN